MASKNIIVLLGDQLSPNISSLQAGDSARDVVFMVESKAAASRVPYHKKKLAFLFSAMRHFAEALKTAGWQVDYVTLDASSNTGSLTQEVSRAVARHQPAKILVTEPSHWAARQSIVAWGKRFHCAVDVLEDDRFLCSHTAFGAWAEGRKQLRMEYFYREMRKKTGLLMSGAAPEGGKWNFDTENRKPAKGDLFIPQPKHIAPDKITEGVLALVEKHFENHFGDLTPFWFAVTADQAEAAQETFLSDALPRFGDFQDAMLTGQKFLYHSVLSQYMNVGLLDPLAVCRRVENEYRAGRVPLNAAEGFIRQIIGWREYVRGLYWLKMPDYGQANYFAATRPLPAFYWTGDTDMACLAAAIGQTKEDAYAHHIQRLMVTGNFAMLLGVDPREVHEWYLAVYADAYDWVEMPNTIGMSQFADGGLLGSKPYAASGNYINKMSDYCASCRYKFKEKTGPDACPFNALYWDFVARNESKLRGNPRLGQTYRTWDRMTSEKQTAYLKQARRFLEQIV